MTRYLTDAQRETIKKMALEGATTRRMAAAVGCSPPTAGRIAKEVRGEKVLRPLFVGVRLDHDTYDRLDRNARGLGMSYSAYVRHLIATSG